MSNFDIFNKKHLEILINPFLPGAAPAHVTPVSYQAVTSDLFLLLFRTTGPDGKNYFFVSLETDYLAGQDAARSSIEKWLGTLEEMDCMWPVDQENETNEPSVKTTGPYKAFLFKITKPHTLGYWSDAVTVQSEDDMQKISGISDAQKETIRGFIKNNKKVSVYKTSDTTVEIFYWP